LKNLFLFKIFVFLFITLFCILGTWQLYRLQWKQSLINQISEGLKSTPIRYSQNIKKNYQKVILVGEYDFKNQIYLYSLNDKGQPGFDVVTPFVTDSKENVLVNRGWIRKQFKNTLDINISSKNITGMLRQANRKNFFTPDNDINKNIWFSINLKDIQIITGKKFNKFIVYLDDQSINTPKPKKITIDVPNNHLKYAITWYSISISILFYYLYFRKKNEIF
jgi:surfeit locus 1 family protein|tara:strand:+ start:104 stop:766 length:663 start_codon:yes stop_codon:yes gene_type:complete